MPDVVVVIAAGYTGRMDSFLTPNPGLASRFTRTVEFADHPAEELVLITESMCETHRYELDPRTLDALAAHQTSMTRNASLATAGPPAMSSRRGSTARPSG